jgi:hypothetical protein
VNGGVVIFQTRRGTAAGDDGGLGCQRRARSATIFVKPRVSVHAQERGERERGRRGGTGGLYHAGIGEALRRYLRTSTSNCVGLGRLEQEKKRGKREERGGFIGEVLMAFNSRGKSAE